MKATTHRTGTFLPAFKKSFSYHDWAIELNTRQRFKSRKQHCEGKDCHPDHSLCTHLYITRNVESMHKVPHLSVAHASTSAAQAFGEAAESKGFPQRRTCAAWSNAHLKAFTASYSFQGSRCQTSLTLLFETLGYVGHQGAKNSQSRTNAK